MISNFIVVDDDPINNIICCKTIQNLFPEADVLIFTDPESALSYLELTYPKTNTRPTVLFLDINMPALSGWEFLEAFERFDPIVKQHLNIYMLSSSIDPRDKERAARNSDVFDYIEKPLTTEKLENLLTRF